jgi:alkaline phosphatase D
MNGVDGLHRADEALRVASRLEPCPHTRREFLRRASLALAATLYAPVPTRARVRVRAYPFTLGVASGDPLPGGVVLWTRLAPDPLQGGGMPAERVRVDWEIAHDEQFRRIAKRGSSTAAPEFAHSVRIEVDGLEPDRVYWYRFLAGGEASPVGRTRTAPARALDRLDFAFVSCQDYEQGYYTGFRHLAGEDSRFIVHLGDYIYEDGIHEERPRRHDGPEIQTLGDYRRRYALYKSDADLQASHAAAPWIVSWDDHEVDNNYAGAIAEDGAARDAFLRRRAAAYQAFWEHMPVRNNARPRGADARMYRRLAFGDLLDLFVLDTRQYRTDQPCGDGRVPRCAGVYDARGTMLGAAQERWLLDGLGASRARWNVLANQVMIAQLDGEPGPAESFAMDKWDGYFAARRRLLGFLRDRRANTVVLTGDIHANWVAELRPDFEDERGPVVGVEFVGTSISSGGDGSDTTDVGRRGLSANPHLRFFNAQRGYVRCSVTPEQWISDYRVLEYVTRVGSPIATRASFIVENGRPGVHAV